MLERHRVRGSLRSWCGTAVVVLAVFSITASLATRFAALDPEVQQVTSVKSLPSDAKRQHLLSDALQWIAPASGFTLFQPPRSSVFAVSVVVL